MSEEKKEILNDVQHDDSQTQADAEFESIVGSVADAPVRSEQPREIVTEKSVVKSPRTEAPAKSEIKKKKKKRRKRRRSASAIIGSIFKTIFLIVFFLAFAAVALGVYLFIGINSDKLTIDSVSRLLNAKGLSVDERISIDEDGASARIYLDKADIWHLVTAEYGEDFIEKTKDGFNEKGLRLAGYGLIIDENDSQIDLDVRWNSFKIPVHVPIEISFDDSQISFSPTGVRAFKIDFSPKFFKFLSGFDVSTAAFSVPVKPMGFIKSFDSMSIRDDCLRFDVSLNPALLKDVCVEHGFPEHIAWFAEGYSEITEAAALYTEDPAGALKAFLAPAIRKDGELERLLAVYYTMASSDDKRSDLAENGAFILKRVLYGYTEDGFAEGKRNLVSFCDGRRDMLFALAESLSEEWAASKISIDKDYQFIYKKEVLDISLFTPEGYEWQSYEAFVPAEGITPVIVRTEDAYLSKIPALKKLTASRLELGENLDKDTSYALGFVAKTANSQCLLCYVAFTPGTDGAEDEVFPVCLQIPEQEYIRLMEEEAIPVFGDGE